MDKKQNVKKNKSITSMNEDFAQWYTDIVKKAELVDYSPVKGCMIIRPYGYAIWENIQKYLDRKFKESGHENVYMPMLIPESLLQVEKDHVEGFAPEVAWVTHGGENKLSERLCIRPTSETLFCDHWAKTVESYNDLPKLYNQWCSVLRWEKTTRPFLRTMEFLWQEGHTLHISKEEAEYETINQLNTYIDLFENFLAIPVLNGRKTDKEKFAGALETYTVESMMKDGKALQSATSHNFGDGFAKAFNIKYADKDGKLKHPFQTSWGLSTRTIGAVIMVHGDDNGLVLAPKVAPIQVAIIPVASHKEGVIEKALEIESKLKKNGLRIKCDISDKSPGWKFSQYEMKGVPIRLEIGPRDIEKNECILARRDTGEKITVSLDNIEEEVEQLLCDIHNNMLNSARERMQAKIYETNTKEEINDAILNKDLGFYKAPWCGSLECEEKMKEEFSLSSRCILLEEENKENGVCPICGKKANHMVIWGKSY